VNLLPVMNRMNNIKSISNCAIVIHILLNNAPLQRLSNFECTDNSE